MAGQPEKPPDLAHEEEEELWGPEDPSEPKPVRTTLSADEAAERERLHTKSAESYSELRCLMAKLERAYFSAREKDGFNEETVLQPLRDLIKSLKASAPK